MYIYIIPRFTYPYTLCAIDYYQSPYTPLLTLLVTHNLPLTLALLLRPLPQLVRHPAPSGPITVLPVLANPQTFDSYGPQSHPSTA